MIRIELTPEGRTELERTFKGTPDRRLRDRCQAVLMADRGRRRGQIAADLGVHRASVHRWLRAYQARGLAGLRIRWAAGQPPRLPEARAETILAWVRDGPQGCGLERANWTYAELATHLCRVHGIEVRATAMRAFCRRHGVRPYRPTYRYLRGDPERQEAARAELAGLKKSRAR
ncbi:MAG TPA: helix-turn-helix domain-containing protein [Geminicoccaceae bacterium]|nr:helix-turn-helix domain-containing protein [Geminicoccaceae bacterium]